MNVNRLTLLGALTLGLGVVAITFGDTACSLAVDTSSSQCDTTADCTARGGAFSGLICSDQHVCVAQGGCNTNAECQSANGGKPFICRHNDRTCVLLTSPTCTLLSEPSDIANEQTLWFGLLSDTVASPSFAAGAEVARQEFHAIGNGLPPANPGGQRRPYAFVSCQAATSLGPSLQHLVNDLQVPAIVGPSDSGESIKALTGFPGCGGDAGTGGSADGSAGAACSTVAAGTFLFSPTVTTVLVDSLDTKGLWARVTASDDAQVTLLNQILTTYIEPKLRGGATPVLGPTDQMKVEIIHVGDALGKSLASRIASRITFNGKKVGDNGTNFLDVDYGDPADPNNTTPQALYKRAIDQTTTFAPHAIFVVGRSEWSQLDSAIEAGWTAGAPRPYYLPTSSLASIISADIKGNIDWAKRVYGSRFYVDRTTPQYVAFSGEFTSAFPALPATALASSTPSFYYDAAFFLGYAVAAIGSKPVTGANLAAATKSLIPPNRKLNVGSGTMFDALQTLAAGTLIDVDGLNGTEDFHPDGNVDGVIEEFCMKVTTPADGGAPTVTGVQGAGVTIDSATSTVKGTLSASCPQL